MAKKIKIAHKLESISDIPQGNYQGYFWGSGAKNPGAKNPIVVNREFKPFIPDEESLFIQEAMLWDKENKISIMINYTHRMNIYLYDFNEINMRKGIKSEDKQYLAHRIKDKEFIHFKQIWLPEPDPLCKGMAVLKMKAQVFVGFGE